VSALIPRNDRESWREQVHDLPFAFVAPLGAKYRDVHNRSIVPGLMIFLDGSSLTLEQLTAIADDDVQVALAPGAARRIEASRQVVDRAAAGTEPVYGINTRFGALAETAVPHEALGALQLNLLRSHAAGVDEPLPVRTVRATMALRANVLAKGFSGIRCTTVEHLLALLNRRVHPRVPSRGSVGASGDLAPLAHLSLVLVGEGEATVAADPEVLSGRAALARAGLEPVTLGPKEGIALINGTQPSTAIAALALVGAERLARAADVTAALSIDALRGSIKPFDARFFPMRGPTMARSSPPATSAACWKEARSTRRTPIAAASRTPTRCAARPRCTVPPERRSVSCAGSSLSRPTPPRTTRWSFAETLTAQTGMTKSSPVAISTARPSRWPRTFSSSHSPSWQRSASGGPIASSIRCSAICRPS
jgi:hypothetical protein